MPRSDYSAGANTAIQNLNAEKSQLQAALDRANGERARFVHEFILCARLCGSGGCLCRAAP